MIEPEPITKDNFIDSMIAVCPSFQHSWVRFKGEWTDNPILFERGGDGTLPHYLLLGELADHLVGLLELGETDRFSDIFSVVESWVVDGEHYVSEAAVVGLLEDLSASHRYKTAHPSQFVRWLGPASRKWWTEVIVFWDRLDKGNFRPLSID